MNSKKEIKCELHCKIVRGVDCIAKLSEDWDSLFKRAHKAPPYFSRAWIQTFMTEKHIKGKPLLITVWSDSKLVALLPLTICSYFGIKVAKVAPSTILCYTGILLDPDYRQAILAAIEVLLQEKVAHVFYNKYTLTGDEFTNKFFEELTHHEFVCRRWKRHVCLKAYLEPDFDQVLKRNRTHKQREKLLYHERRILKSGDVKMTRYIGKQITPDITARIADIQMNSWVKEEGKAILAQPFYQKLLFELGQADIGCAWILANDVEDIAFLYGLRANDSLYIKWMSYSLKYGSSSLSFGKSLYTQVIRDACNEGLSEVDLGFGEDKWKELWATESQSIARIIAGRGLIAHAAILCYNVLRWCARIKWILYCKYKKLHKIHK